MASKFIKAGSVLVEYAYSPADELLGEDYWVLYNKRVAEYSFCQDEETFGSASVTNNVQLRQLVATDSTKSRWTPFYEADTGVVSNQYSASGLVQYDTVTMHFPVDWVFEGYQGVSLRVWVWDATGKKRVYLSNYYYDKELHSSSVFGSLELTSPRLRFAEALYGKRLEVKVPSAYYVSRQQLRTQHSVIPQPGSINDTATGGVGLSQSSPVYVEVSMIASRASVSGRYFYYLESSRAASVPQAPEYQTIGVSITESTDSDSFQIFGVQDGTASGFASFMDRLDAQGGRSYVKYAVTVFEQNVPGRTQTFLVEEDFHVPIDYVPVIRFSTTTAGIDVTMSVVSYADGSEVVKQASLLLSQSQINKFGRRRSRVNLSGAYKPKIYNPVPARNVLPAPVVTGEAEPVIQFYPIMYDRSNIVLRAGSTVVGDEVFYGMDELTVSVDPFTNVYKFVVASKIGEAVEFLNLPPDTRVQMVFRGSNSSLMAVSELYRATNEVDLSKGVMVFYFDEELSARILRMHRAGDRRFYLVISNANSVESKVYSGYFEAT